MKNIFVITDNLYIYREFNEIIEKRSNVCVSYFCSPKSLKTFSKEIGNGLIKPLNMREDYQYLVDNFIMGISCHSKQLFPALLVNNVKCINIHPGLNPYNRGWFPQVFSIINGLPSGATIHLMDEEIDHGDIIIQEEVKINSYDNSLDVYNKVISKEMELLEKNIGNIISGNFNKFQPRSEGNYNSMQDYKSLCEIDLNKQVTMKEAINYLRAMTHPPYKNCYFLSDSGDKVFVSIILEKQYENNIKV